MNSTTYQLSSFTGLMSHGLRRPQFVRDGVDEPQEYTNRELEAQVRSGDYFIALATTLDSLSRDVADYPTKSKLEDVVSDLIYLYDHYKIDKDEHD